MKKFGKTIKLFLIDGEPNGRMTCELSNWTGKAYRIPRILIKESADRDELKNPGVYLLFGKNEEGKLIVYIGEAEIIFDRLKQHLSQKDFWNEVIAFISKDENLNKAHIKYLENKLFEKAQKINRYILENNSIPTKSSISESDRAEMEEFIENIKLLTNTLGHKVFEEIRETKTIKQERQKTFEIKAVRGASAKGIPTSSGFVVFKDSEIATSTVNSLTGSFRKLRDKIIDEKIVIEKDKKLVFSKDFEFSSPSTAAVMVLGRNANGLTEWKLADGKTLKEFETEEK
ncbi:MAG: GIY-YIG nuclease family protein [Bacteroidales bacterium]|nr:GIY-YIG nuclease family protein [Bacteroidales bacterium]